MSDKSNIQWTDSTHNFWRGCTKVSPGCAHCYAETLVTNRLGGEWGKGKPRIRTKEFNKPLAWNKRPWVCDVCGHCRRVLHAPCFGCLELTNTHRRRVFSLSLGDIGDEEVSLEWFIEAMAVVEKCRQLTFQLLTKRPKEFLYRWNTTCARRGKSVWDTKLPSNVWMGVSAENQETANERIPELLKINASVRFVSAEPLLENINLLHLLGFKNADGAKIDWVIFGGESGPQARPCNIQWIREGIRQCKGAGVAAFVKQLGSRPFGIDRLSVGVKCDFAGNPFLRDKKGGDMAEWPENLRVREFPKL